MIRTRSRVTHHACVLLTVLMVMLQATQACRPTDTVAAATVGVITETNAEKAIEELKAYEVSLMHASKIHISNLHTRPSVACGSWVCSCTLRLRCPCQPIHRSCSSIAQRSHSVSKPGCGALAGRSRPAGCCTPALSSGTQYCTSAACCSGAGIQLKQTCAVHSTRTSCHVLLRVHGWRLACGRGLDLPVSGRQIWPRCCGRGGSRFCQLRSLCLGT